MKRNFLILGMALLAIAILSASSFFGQKDSKPINEQRTSLIIRNIGHELLLYAGDSTSRILPIQKINEKTFQLEFQNNFSFSPDTLVKIVRTNLAREDIEDGYDVNVFECVTEAMVYGFEIAPAKISIVPCLKRIQPTACYRIQISFLKSDHRDSNNSFYYFFTIAGICLIGFIGMKYFRKEVPIKQFENQYVTKIGNYFFYRNLKTLKIDAEDISLSDKECEILAILASQPNELISRDRLLKEIWEDQGVFTGRSLDMFISKIRKKLIKDPHVQISNVHARGYKLEIRDKE